MSLAVGLAVWACAKRPPTESAVQVETCGNTTRDARFVPAGGDVAARVAIDDSVRSLRVAVCAADPARVDRVELRMDDGRAGFDAPVFSGPSWVTRSVPLTNAERTRPSVAVTLHVAALSATVPAGRNGAYVSIEPVRVRSSDHPSVILVSIDTLRADRLSTYGYPLPTDPNISALAAQGTLFTQAISQAPSTPPSHGAMLTGVYPARTGLFVLGDVGSRGPHGHFGLRSDLPTLAGRLRDAGYYTAAITGGGFVSQSFGFARGFDSFREDTSALPGEGMRTAASAIAWLDGHLDSRFFLFLHTYEVHVGQYGYQHEYFRLQHDKDAFYARHTGTPDAPTRNARYDSGVQFVDEMVGQIVRFLAARGRLQDTIVVITADHGETMDERVQQAGYAFNHGFSLYDELVHVPLVMAGRGIPAGRRIDRQVEVVDLMPTILDLSGTGVRGLHLDGRSLVPLLNGRPGYDKTVAYSESVAGGPFRSAIRMDGFKYVRVLSWALTSATIMTSPPPEELYDLRRDPGETHNVAKAPAYAAVVARMRAQFDRSVAAAGTLQVVPHPVKFQAGR